MYITMCLYITITILLWVLSKYPFIKHYTIVVSIISIQFSHTIDVWCFRCITCVEIQVYHICSKHMYITYVLHMLYMCRIYTCIRYVVLHL